MRAHELYPRSRCLENLGGPVNVSGGLPSGPAPYSAPSASGFWPQYLADWLAWLGVSTTVGSGDGLLGGGGGLSGSSASSRASSLIWTVGRGQVAAPGPLAPGATTVEQGGWAVGPGPAGGVEVEGQAGGVMGGGPPGTNGCCVKGGWGAP